MIQITDPGTVPPETKYSFAEKHHFQFHDTDCPKDDEVAFSEDDAKAIVDILKKALDNNQAVIVHCHAGLCRSGAVTEVGIMMGFEDTKRTRMSNRRVKFLLMTELGWSYR